LTAGLPTEDHYGTVLRDALCTDGADPAGVVRALERRVPRGFQGRGELRDQPSPARRQEICGRGSGA
ncbi:hypothetical protein, partial [Streptomyces mirabilis]|uniref:hypothetical protein n=1 Tax=Streptomyces mirabilis TaxID=68239 RepID=UPI0036834466